MTPIENAENNEPLRRAQLETEKLDQEIRKAQLEQEKIRAELVTLTRPWYRQSAYIAALLPIITTLATIATIATGTWITYKNSEFKREADQAKQQIQQLQPEVAALRKKRNELLAQKKKLQDETKQLSEGYIKLSTRVDEIKKAIAPRTLSQQQKAILRREVAPLKDGTETLHFMGLNGPPEWVLFANKVGQLIGDALVRVANPVQLHKSGAHIASLELPPSGIGVYVEDPKAPSREAKTLFEALHKAGLKPHMGKYGSAGEIYVIVGGSFEHESESQP